MIQRNPNYESAEAQVESDLRQGMLGGLFLEGLLLRERDARPAVEAIARRIIAIEDAGIDLTPYAQQHQGLFVVAGRAAYAENDFEAAEMAWDEAVKMNPNDRKTRLKLGILQMCMGNPAIAEKTIYRASIRSLSHLTSLYEVAAQRERDGHAQAAQVTRDGSMKVISRESADILQALAEARLQQGKYGPAKSAFERCLALDPTRDDAAERLSLAYRAILAQKFGRQ